MIKRSRKALMSSIFALVVIIVMGFTLRAISDLSDYRHFVSVAKPNMEYTWDGHIKVLTNLLWISEVPNMLILPLCATAIANFVLTFAIKHFRVKSHIEYCGKNMVRSIMLQWHPN